MDKIILEPQNASVRGRQILDLVPMVNEFLDSIFTSGGILFKLDIAKTYDHVNWKFLLYLLAFILGKNDVHQ